MNPLSPLTYYLAHKRQTLLLIALVALMTLGVSVMVRLPDSLLEHMAYSESVVTRVSLVSAIEPSLAPKIAAQIRAHPGVAQVIQERGLSISLPPISGSYHFFAVAERDLLAVLTACDLRVRKGRLPRPQANEIALSESIARGIGKGIGGEIRRPPAGSDEEAWFAGLCLIGLLGMQAWLYAPKGFTINVLNPLPWLFTLPLPVATLTVGTTLIARMLRKLDPVAVIETR